MDSRLIKDIEAAYGPDAAKLCLDVTTVVRAKVRERDLFGWRTFIDEMLEDLVGYMIADGFKHSGGGYVACGMQSAIDHCRYCNAEKRRGDYELVSLEEFYQVEETETDTTQEKATMLLDDIALRFGTSTANKLEAFVRGYEDKPSKQVKDIIMKPEFIEWFRDYVRER